MNEAEWKKLIERYDKQNMYKIISEFDSQSERAVEIARRAKLASDYRKAKNILVAGLGGSAIGGDILYNCIGSELTLPLKVVRDYELPAFINNKTLFFAVSYSGNTEETLSCYREAVLRSCKIIGITSGGKLADFCEADRNPLIRIPGGMPPRTALAYLFFPMLVCLERLAIIQRKSVDLKETISVIRELRGKYCSLPDNPATELSHKLYGRIPIIYGSEKSLSSAVYRWRTQINENSKTLTYHHVFPEMNHNEIVGWERLHEISQHFRVVLLRDEADHGRVKTRMEITKSILGDTPAGIDEIWSKGESLLARIFSLIYLGDFVSFYLAMLNGVDPTPVERIEMLKRRLAGE